MLLPEDSIAEYQSLYLKQFGVNLSTTEATEQAHKLIRLYQIFYKETTKVRD